MDLGEKLFGMISNWRRQRRDEERASYQYELKDCEKALALVVQPFFEEPVEIHASKQSGVKGVVFYLPSSISFFRDRRRNRDLYLHQILMLAGAQKLTLCWPEGLSEGSERENYFSGIKDRIIESISQIYPCFQAFQRSLLTEFSPQLTNPREQWLLWGGLSSGVATKTIPSRAPTPRERKKNESEQVMETSFERDEVDLEKEPENPVTHSFEKMETADEYQGGSRTADGSDQLSDHSEALKELKLNKVTRSGETAASFLSSDFQNSSEGELATNLGLPSSQEIIYYPEWHHKKKSYLANHCRLFVSQAEIASESGQLRQRLAKEHASLIARHKQQIQQIYNQRKWRDQQADGPEVDIDAFVRHLSDLRNKVASPGRLYLNQFLRSRDFQVLVLLDLSLSTDSYVENRRVLDVELESAGLIGLLSEEGRDNTMVAGTFSETRHHCAFEVLKNPHEDWTAFYKRAPAVVPRGYTRLAPALRHATKILSKSTAKMKVLLLLTDGKPTDYDGYEGRYGIEDIRKACLEAHAQNIMTKAFAIEKQARHYFPQMFGSFEILSSPEKLPHSLVKTLLETRAR